MPIVAILEEKIGKAGAHDLIADFHTFLSFRNMKKIFKNENVRKVVTLKYDIPRWISGEKEILTNLTGKFSYIIDLPREKKEGIGKITDMNKDLELSLQILYRDGTIRDFWPVWWKSEAIEI